MSELPTLLARVRACTLCAAYLPAGPRPVLQVHGAARILIASQAPGRRVHGTGVPFDDASGDTLRAWLGVDRATFYDARRFAILPMGFCYPGNGRSGDLPPRPECAPAWRERLLAHLPRVELTLVIGAYAQRWHLDEPRSVTAAVRDWRRRRPRVLPLPHPSPRNRAWLRNNPWLEEEVLPALGERVRSLLQSASASTARTPALRGHASGGRASAPARSSARTHSAYSPPGTAM